MSSLFQEFRDSNPHLRYLSDDDFLEFTAAEMGTQSEALREIVGYQPPTAEIEPEDDIPLADQFVGGRTAVDALKTLAAGSNKLVALGGDLLAKLGFEDVGRSMSEYGDEQSTALMQGVEFDHIKGAAAGAQSAVSGVGQILQMIGAEDVGRKVREYGADQAEALIKSMSERGQKSASSLVFEDDPDSITGYRLSDNWADATLMGAAMSAPSMILAAVPGSIITSALQGLAKLGLAGGGGATLGLLAGAKTPAGLVEKIIARVPAGVGYGSAEGLVAGAMEAADFRGEVEKTSFKELEKSPVFRALKAQFDGDAEKARLTLAEQAASDVFTRTTLSTGTIGALTGGGALGLLHNQLTGKAGKEYLKRTLLEGGLVGAGKAVGKGALQEGIQETPQTGGEALIRNIATRDYLDPDKDIWEGVGAQALTGGAIGSFMGGFVGGGGHIIAARGATPEELLRESAVEAARSREIAPEGRYLAAATQINAERQRLGLDAILAAPDLDAAIDAATQAAGTQPVTPEDLGYQGDLLHRAEQFAGAPTIGAPTIGTPTIGTPPAARGRPTEIVTPDGATVAAEWQVVSAASLRAQMEVGATQPRDRKRATSEVQIESIASAPDYRRTSDSPVMDVGAPTIDASGNVIAGNARLEGITRAHQRGTATDYTTSLLADMQSKGMDPAAAQGITDPVLIRRITDTAFDGTKAAVQSNTGLGLQYSGMELARLDSDRMQGIEAVELDEKGDVVLTDKNRATIGQLFRGYEQTEIAALTDKKTGLSQDGVRRVRNAILHRAYGDTDTLARMIESTDNDTRAVVGALARAAASAVKAGEAIAAGTAPKGLDVTADIVAAVELIASLKARGLTLDQYTKQQKIDTDPVSPRAIQIARFLTDNIRSQKAMGDFLSDIYTQIAAVNVKARTVLDEAPTAPKLQDIISRAAEGERDERLTPKSKREGEREAAPLRDLEATTEGERDERLTPKSKREGERDEREAKQLEREAATLERVLKRKNNSYTVEAASLRDLEAMAEGAKAELETARKIAAIFGKRIVVVKVEGPDGFNGIVIRELLPNTIFIGIGTNNYIHAVVGHELSHHMEIDAPQVYQELVEAIATLAPDIAGYRKDYSITDDALSDIGVVKEIIGDLMGDNFTKQAFWNKVAKANPTAFERIAKVVINWLKKLVTRANAEDMGGAQWVSDVKAAQNAIAKAVAQYTGKVAGKVAQDKGKVAADAVHKAADKLKDEAFGQKVFVSRVYEQMSQDGELDGVTLEQFKQVLLELNRLNHIELARADLGYALDKKNVAASEIANPYGATFHFIRMGGPKFSVAGRKSKTADLHQLDTAIADLAKGKDAEDVRYETGWYKEKDGMWRYEISDDQARITKDPMLVKMFGWDWENELGAHQWRVYNLVKSLGTVRLGNLLHHVKLFTAYPMLAAMKVSVLPEESKSIADYNKATDTIRISDMPTDKDTLSAILHEVQHGLQSIEGFSHGASLADIIENAFNYVPTPVRDAALVNAMSSEGYQNLADLTSGESLIEARMEFLESAVGEAVWEFLISPVKAYVRVLGEVEARNTQERMSMTDAERRVVAPKITQDPRVTDANVIVMMGGEAMDTAPTPANSILFSRVPAGTMDKAKVEGEYGVTFETGMPVTFNYVHNTESATKHFGMPKKGDRFLRDKEPSGKYVNHKAESVGAMEGGETGSITFENPLVIPNDNLQWKASLSKAFGDKTGKNLSKALIAAGIDGVVTVETARSGKTHTSEILDLTGFDETKAKFSRIKIAVDGVQRPAENSEGKPIHVTEEGIRGFWRWFSDSKVIDDRGRPLVMYHGTDADFSAFDASKMQKKDSGFFGAGFYFTADPETAAAYSTYDEGAAGSNVMPVYLKLKRPYVWPDANPPAASNEDAQQFTQNLREIGYDGVQAPHLMVEVPHPAFYEVVAFDPSQVKSAIGNLGTFSGGTPNILFSKIKGHADLIVLHNLSEENLLHAGDLGGLAMPSIAITKTSVGFTNFGEISLIAHPDILNARDMRTFAADAYSPRHPTSEFNINSREHDKVRAQIEESLEGLPLKMPSVSDMEDGHRGVERLTRSPAVGYHWLKLQGIAPKPRLRKIEPNIKRLIALAKKEGLTSAWRIDESQKMQEAITKELRDTYQGDTRFFEEDGITPKPHMMRDRANKVANLMGMDIDSYRLETDVHKALRPKHRSKAYEAFALDLFNQMNDGRRIFKGVGHRGRRYVPYNLANVMKEMRAASVRGGEGHSSPGALRARFAPELKTKSQIQAARDRILDAEGFEAHKGVVNDTVADAIDKLAPYYKWDAESYMYSDNAMDAIGEGPAGWREAFNLDDTSRKIIGDLITFLKAQPTEYFETKAQRVVHLNEFKAAVVPSDASAEAIALLKRKGITVTKYKRNDADARNKALEAAGKKAEALFSRKKTPLPRELDYERLETRAGTTEKQRELGRAAYRDIVERIIQRVGGTVHGNAIARDIHNKGGTALIGQEARWVEDLATIAQVLRDPRYETFRVFYTKDDRIVHHISITSRVPGSVTLVTQGASGGMEQFIENLRDQKKASGANGYWLLHNHPSGTSTPSAPDINVTKFIAANVPGFRYHVIIDHNEFSAIAEDGGKMTKELQATGGYSGPQTKPHTALGRVISNSDDMAQVGKMIERTQPDSLVIVGRSSQATVRAVAEIPIGVLEGTGVRLLGQMRAFARNSGSDALIIVAPDRATWEKLEPAVESGVLLDAIYDGGTLVHSHAEKHGPGFDLFTKGNVRAISVAEPKFSRKKTPFYSALEREVKNLRKLANKSGEIKANQAALWIEARQKEGKFKREEVEIVGVQDWLKGLGTEAVSVDAVENFVAQNGVQVEEVMHGQEERDTERMEELVQERFDDEVASIVDDARHDYWYENLSNAAAERDMYVDDMTRREQDDLLEEVMPRADRWDEVAHNMNYRQDQIREELEDEIDYHQFEGGSDVGLRTHFSHWTEPGGKDYKELALILPGDTKFAVPEAHHMSEDANINRLAHIRFDTRHIATEASDAQTSLFIQEFQSDWAQQGREKGFVPRGEAELTEKLFASQDKWDKLREEVQEMTGLGWSDITEFIVHVEREGAAKAIESGAWEDVYNDRFGGVWVNSDKAYAKLDEIAARRRELIVEQEKLIGAAKDKWYVAKKRGATIGTPYATEAEALAAITDDTKQEVRRGTVSPGPFVTDTKAWVRLAFKRMLSYAVENGFTSITWTTGKQQAERYKLSRVADEIEYGRNADGTFNIQAYKAVQGGIASEPLSQSILRNADIEEVAGMYGKDIAKIVESHDGGEPVSMPTEGLEVGGVGMREFYDVILAQEANDVLKKIKGPRIGMMQVDGLGQQPGFEIAPELAETVSKGLPLFSRRRVTPKQDAEYMAAVKGGNVKKAQQMIDDAAKAAGYSVGPVAHRTNEDFTVFDLSKASKSAVWGPAIYASLDDKGTWNPQGLKGGRDIRGMVGGEVIDMTQPLPPRHLERLSDLVGSSLDSIPLITLEKRYGSVAEGLKAAGFSAAIHEGPGRTGAHIAVFDPNQIKSAEPITRDDAGNVIPLSKRFNPAEDDIRFSRQSALDKAGVARPQGERASILPGETREDQIRRVGQDDMRRFKVVQEFLKEKGVDLQESADVYTRENLSKSHTANKIEDFARETVEPLLKDIGIAKVSLDDLVVYLEARHIPEANERMRALHKDPNATANGITDAQAQQVAAEFAAMPKFAEFKALADRIRAIADGSLDMQLAAGLISQEKFDNYRNAYSEYVPLRGNAKPEEFGKGRGLSTQVKGKRRKGHDMRGDEFILENILAARDQAIRQIENNKVSMAVLEFLMAANHPDIGTVGKPVLKQSIKDHAFAVKYQGRILGSFETKAAADAAMNRVLSGANQQLMSSKQSGFDPSLLHVEKVYDPHLITTASPMIAENEIVAMVAGHEIRMQLNDPLLARAATKAGISQVAGIFAAARDFNQFLSKMYTQYSPDFILTNMSRDAYSALVVLPAKEGVGFLAKTAANYPAAFKELSKAIADPNASAWVKEWRDGGGNIGAAYMSDLERVGDAARDALAKFQGAQRTYAEAFAREKEAGRSDTMAHKTAVLRAGKAGLSRTPVLGSIFQWISRLNAIIENTLRLATYMTAIESGMPKQKASMLSKDLMNFNRKGEMANWLGAGYLFVNPGIQGADIVYNALFEAKHKKQAWAMVGSLTALGFLMAEMLRGGDDEEEGERRRANTPDHVMYRNIVIPVGDKQVTIPVAYGWGFFHAMGVLMSDAMHGKEQDLYKASIKIVDAFLENFFVFGNPITDVDGEPGFNPFLSAPTALKTLGGPGVNLDSFGNPIMPHKWSEAVPDSESVTKSLRGGSYHQLAAAVNSGTGGNKYEPGFMDVSPNTLKYWVTSLTGGAGRFVSDSVTGVADLAAGVDIAVESIPIVRRFVREPGVKDSRTGFWNAKREVTTAAARFNRAKREGDHDYADAKLDKSGDLIELLDYANKQTKFANQIRDEIIEIQADGTLSRVQRNTMIRALEKDEKDVYDEFLRAFDDR